MMSLTLRYKKRENDFIDRFAVRTQNTEHRPLAVLAVRCQTSDGAMGWAGEAGQG